MIVSRCVPLGRVSTNVVKNFLVQNGKTGVSQQIRHHTEGRYYYRSAPLEGPSNVYLYEMLGGAVWWWVLWHLFTDYHELLPHPFPDPSKWTDEELGIPPLDA